MITRSRSALTAGSRRLRTWPRLRWSGMWRIVLVAVGAGVVCVAAWLVGGSALSQLVEARASSARDEVAWLLAAIVLGCLAHLQQLGALRAQGVLTEAEFEARKRKILDG